MPPDDRITALLAAVRGGDREAFGALFELFRDRLLRMAQVRLDRRVTGRVAAEDVVQEAYLDAAARVGEYLADPAVPVYVWLRFLTAQRLLMVQRAHLGAKRRAVTREVSAVGPTTDVMTSPDSMAAHFAGHLTTPSGAAMRREAADAVRAALAATDPLDREVLAMRHFEELPNAEVATLLGLTPAAASKRYVRALRKLRDALGGAAAPPV